MFSYNVAVLLSNASDNLFISSAVFISCVSQDKYFLKQRRNEHINILVKVILKPSQTYYVLNSKTLSYYESQEAMRN